MVETVVFLLRDSSIIYKHVIGLSCSELFDLSGALGDERSQVTTCLQTLNVLLVCIVLRAAPGQTVAPRDVHVQM